MKLVLPLMLLCMVYLSESCINIQFHIPDYNCDFNHSNQEEATKSSNMEVASSTEAVLTTTRRNLIRPSRPKRPGHHRTYKFGSSLGSVSPSGLENSIVKRSLQNRKNKQKDTIFYSISNYPKGLTKDQTLKTIRKAFDVWCNEAKITCRYTESNSNANVVVEFTKPIGWEEDQISDHKLGSGRRRSYIYLNCRIRWSLSKDNDDNPNLLATAIHEIGHIFGLAHSNNVESVMYPVLDNSKTELSNEDIKQIRYLFRNEDTTDEDETTIFSLPTAEYIETFEPEYVEIEDTHYTDHVPDYYYHEIIDKKK